MFPDENFVCRIQLGKNEYFVPNTKVTKNYSEKLCESYKGKVSVFSQHVFSKKAFSCLTKSALLVKQSNSSVSKSVLVVFGLRKTKLLDINVYEKRKVLCTRKSTNQSNSSKTSTSSMSSRTGLFVALGTTLVLLIGIPSILFGVEPIKVNLLT